MEGNYRIILFLVIKRERKMIKMRLGVSFPFFFLILQFDLW